MHAPYLRSPWLIVVWPGSGRVGSTFGDQLLDQLEPRRLESIGMNAFLAQSRVDIDSAPCVGECSAPEIGLFAWRNPQSGPDLLIAVADASPTRSLGQFVTVLLERAKAYGCDRMIAIDSLAAPIAPTSEPGVYGFASHEPQRDELMNAGAWHIENPLGSELNRRLLTHCEACDVPMSILIGEVPFFAIGVPNPRSSLAVLRTFARLTGIELDGEVLRHRADALQQRWTKLFQQVGRHSWSELTQNAVDPEASNTNLRESNSFMSDQADLGLHHSPPSYGESTGPGAASELHREGSVDRKQIDLLFESVRADRSRAMELKLELDRCNVFSEYEDRFLDLFR